MKSDIQEAIDRARTHLRRAARESIEASLALIEAAQLAGGLEERSALVGNLTKALDDWIEALDQERAIRMPTAFIEPLEQALNAEIERWEKRSATDDSARPVLRAFLGLRELLWELGMRHPENEAADASAHDGSGERADPTSDANPDSKKKTRSRVQRFDIED